MGKLLFVTVAGFIGAYVGFRYAQWHKSIRGKRERNHCPESLRRMRDDTNDRE